MEEYVYDGEECKLVKRKVTKRSIPPDIKAVKMLLGEECGDSELTDEELEEERQKLLKLLKENKI